MGRQAREIKIGSVTIGGGHPIAIQSMLCAPLDDLAANARQTRALFEAGCQINRVAIPPQGGPQLIQAIKEASPMPLVADIQFDYRLAIEAAYAGADKIRINPGNIGDRDKVRQVVRACEEKKLPIRIGVNSGSLEKEILAKYQRPTAQALAESALFNIRLLEQFDFNNYVVAIKSSDVFTTIAAYRLVADRVDCPFHLGVTEAGTQRMGLIKSAAAFGALLADGIGDTLRVSLTADPVEEVYAARDILRGLGLEKGGPRFVSCPTCGRCHVDLFRIAREVEDALRDCKKDLKIAIMGCAVNGPGEARDADIGIAGGQGETLLFRKGEILRKVPEGEAVAALLAEVERL
ncbi:MAG: flavodoxin-dependent (E)-4-hydroxy-3-methylbut-2-enyl-diphosphate synthase [Angelakisella sp.]|jgi:(E)-4-hydroxy-3-methylbut-2-enyl-diphosphate synthase|nr:flavodoxin-dependent (E)-4-hydroxy-3-methylbut-2-enyl-diphosphate synthase [Angelakisella sp.]